MQEFCREYQDKEMPQCRSEIMRRLPRGQAVN